MGEGVEESKPKLFLLIKEIIAQNSFLEAFTLLTECFWEMTCRTQLLELQERDKASTQH